MYIHVCHVSCSIVVMFTSATQIAEGARCETWTVATNSKILGWAWPQDACSQGEARIRLSLSPDRGHEERIREVLHEDRCSSMYSNYMHCRLVMSCIHVSCCNSCIKGIGFVILIFVYFSQVKNKPWLPWVYSWFWHCREQKPWGWWLDAGEDDEERNHDDDDDVLQGRMMKEGTMMISYQPLGDRPNFFRSIISNQAITGTPVHTW